MDVSDEFVKGFCWGVVVAGVVIGLIVVLFA